MYNPLFRIYIFFSFFSFFEKIVHLVLLPAGYIDHLLSMNLSNTLTKEVFVKESSTSVNFWQGHKMQIF